MRVLETRGVRALLDHDELCLELHSRPPWDLTIISYYGDK